jgi:2-aminobenzoate-CoA ligase
VSVAYLDHFVSDHLPSSGELPEISLQLAGLSYPDRLNVAVELLDRPVARGLGASIALRTLAETVTYQQLQCQVDGIVRVLREELGLIPGNRVLLRGFNQPLMVACWLAVVKAGGIVVTSMPLLRAGELRQMLDQARVNFVLCDERLLDEARLALAQAAQDAPEAQGAVLLPLTGAGHSLGRLLAAHAATAPPAACPGHDTAADQAALIAFTSGTTGRPKACVHTHRDVLAVSDLFPRSILAVQPEDIFCSVSPLGFTYGLGGLLCFPLRHGASSLLLEQTAPAVMLAAMARARVTICFGVPTFWRQLATLQEAERHDLSHLRLCVSAGEPLDEATRARWRAAAGKEIVDGLGSTELLHIFIAHRPGEARTGAVGQALPGYQLAILDEQGNTLPAGCLGRLAVRGATGCRYLADVRQQVYVQQGWNVTGDTGWLDEAGYYHHCARNDDIIVTAGYNVAGPEVEATLLQHPAVEECGVIGVEDAGRGQIIKACIVLAAGWQADDRLVLQLQSFVKQHIAPYKYPRLIEFVSSLPRTETNKLQRFRLRDASSAAAGSKAKPGTESRTESETEANDQ